MATEIRKNPVNRPNDLKQLEGRHLLVGRSPEFNALTRIRATLLKSARDFFDNDGWLEIAPIPAISTLSGACEDFSTLFGVDYFGREAFLIQTGQQHLEPFIYGPIGKVYAFNQSYRAETKSPERRVTAFLLIEGEAANCDLSRIQSVQERLLLKMCTDVLAWRQDDLEILGANIDKLSELKIPLDKIMYSEAVDRLNKEGVPVRWGDDLTGVHEKALGKQFQRPFFVTHYPGSIKFFNMKDDPDDPRQVLSSDLLVPGYGEVIGSSEREDDYEKLITKLEKFGQDEKRVQDMRKLGITDVNELRSIYEWYVELRKFNGVQHAGFGLGFERLVQWICDLDSIWESTEYPRNMPHLAI